MRAPLVFGLLFAALPAVGQEPAADAPPDASTEAVEQLLAELGAYDERYWVLTDSLGELAQTGVENGADELALLEAEEMAVIAEEFFLEGDAETASSLLAGAIALLEPYRRD